MKRILIAATGLLALAGCGASAINNQPASSSGATTSGASTSTKSPAPSAAHVGATIVLGGNTDGEKLSVQLIKVVDPAKSATAYEVPDAGTHYVAVQFRITNSGTAPYSDSPTNGASVLDAKGQSFTIGFADTTVGASFAGSIHMLPGASELGVMTFQLPNGDSIAKVQYTTDSGFGDTGEWLVP